jgi:2-C-methyl-D-erythritol 4-phosphate cytidylyltransferase
MTKTLRYWAVIPAAGVGTRMQAGLPKQYLTINNKAVIEYTLAAFCNHEKISAVVVAISPHDAYWSNLQITEHQKIRTTAGGKERCHSVLNCLHYLQGVAAADDWVLVHDAVRPCISKEDIDELIKELNGHPVGGLLAVPARDTMKRANDDNIVCETVNRDKLWHALTPQMFRLGDLIQAIETAIGKGHIVTDECQAMEMMGVNPRLVQGRVQNIKVTHKDDLPLVELYLK